MEKFKESMLKDGALKGKTILITGGGTGLGKSMATYFSKLGANIIITSRREEVILKTAEEITAETGGRVLGLQGDVRRIEQVEHVLEKSIEAFGEVNVLVNNAAGNFVSPTERLSHRAFESIIGIVLQGSVNYTLTLGKYWIDKKIKGNVLNISTTYAWTGSSFTVPSACAKAGVLALTRSLAVEWGHKYGIRINAISPGPFPTKGAWDRLFPKAFHEFGNPDKSNPMRRVGNHQELANLASYLVSDYAAYVNGENIVIDGGEWLQAAGMFNKYLGTEESVWDQVAEQIKKS